MLCKKIVALVCVLVLSMGVGLSYAYNIDKEKETNKMSNPISDGLSNSFGNNPMYSEQKDPIVNHPDKPMKKETIDTTYIKYGSAIFLIVFAIYLYRKKS